MPAVLMPADDAVDARQCIHALLVCQRQLAAHVSRVPGCSSCPIARAARALLIHASYYFLDACLLE